MCTFGADAQPRGKDNAPMVRVDGGPFIMGTTDGGDPDERPQRTVTVPAFWIDVREVTNGQYRAFCAATGHKNPVSWSKGSFLKGEENFPVVNVTWEDAAAYARWAGKRLPTEAEWEKAARGTDGRLYPWGNTFDVNKTALDTNSEGKAGGLGDVGRFPAGASPYGCLDMCGNAWEWTADWYDAYPQTVRGGDRLIKSVEVEKVGTAVYSPVSVHYGRKYKAIRGGGAIAYYGILNTGRCADRARSLPFACYDGLGFRCAMDDGPPTPQEMDISPAYVPAPPYVQPIRTAPASQIVLTVREPTGVRRTREIVTSGIPFPEGVLKAASDVRLLDEKGAEVPLQTHVTGTWRDGSIKWVLLDFPCTVGAHTTRAFHLKWSPGRLPARPGVPFHDRAAGPAEGQTVALSVDGKRLTAVPVPSDEPAAPQHDSHGTVLRAVSQHETEYRDTAGKPQFRLRERTQEFGGAPSRRISALTLTQISQTPILNLTDWDMRLGRSVPLSQCVFGGDRQSHRFECLPGDRLELRQESDLRYVVQRNGRVVAVGTRAPGWVAIGSDRRWMVAAIHDFWQQYPLSLVVDKEGVCLRLWAGSQPFDFDRGMAKTVEVLTQHCAAETECERAARAFQQPLFACAPPAWYCASRALGDLEPYSLDRFPDYETAVEADLDLWIRNRPYGLRNWGDAYMGGPYKGKNAYNNLEYDIPYDFLMQFARTGNRKYLEAAIAGARHQADIDTNHLTGQPWKHSPRHTETPAELGHVFLRGLIEYTHFTGDPRGLETARQIGFFLNKAINDPRETGNERQIGWGLYALTAVYAATWDKSYLDACKTFLDWLIAGQQPTGKFSIRYDNRIAFFNGLAMAGMIGYYEATGDEKTPPAILRLADRTLGFYPEYSARTTDGLCWAYDRTGDLRYLTGAVRMWETSVELAAARSWGPGGTLFATRYLPFLVRHGLDRRTERSLTIAPDLLATDNGLYLTHIETPNANLVIQDVSGAPFSLILIRHAGIAPGEAIVETLGPSSTRRTLSFEATSQAAARQRLEIPRGHGQRRLKITLKTEGAKAWDLVTTRPLPRVIQTPALEGIDRLVPHAYFQVEGAAIKARFEAKGEGFHGAVFYDSSGSPVAATTKFIDLGDKGTYTFELTAPIPAGEQGKVWSVDIQDGRLLSFDGISPWFSTTRAAFFAVP